MHLQRGLDCCWAVNLHARVVECAAKVDSCDAKATCLNTPGSFDCVCDAGLRVTVNHVLTSTNVC